MAIQTGRPATMPLNNRAIRYPSVVDLAFCFADRRINRIVRGTYTDFPRGLVAKLIVIGVCVGSWSMAFAAPVPTLFSTGVAAYNDSGQAVLVGEDGVDPHYSLVSTPTSNTPMAAYVTHQETYPLAGRHAAWAPDGSESKWISPHSNEDSDKGGQPPEPAGTYVYRTTFDLSGFDPATVSISGTVYADNVLSDIVLNENDTVVSIRSFSGAPFSIANGFVAGMNTLDFYVINDAGDSANPSGFRVEMTAIPEPSGMAVSMLCVCFCVCVVVPCRKMRN